MKKVVRLTAQGVSVGMMNVKGEDYISLTDITRLKNAEFPADVVRNWMRSKMTIAFLGLWEQLHNPHFKLVEFDQFKNEAGTNAFVLPPQIWIENTNAKGLISKSGRYSELICAKRDDARYVKSSEEVYDLLMPFVYGCRQESFWVVLLGPRNKVIGVPREIAKGQRDEVALQPNLVFETALKEGAKSIIVAHNHPSGDPSPSEEDVVLTRKLVDAGRIMNIPVVDHLILGLPSDGHSGYFSMAAAEMVEF